MRFMLPLGAFALAIGCVENAQPVSQLRPPTDLSAALRFVGEPDAGARLMPSLEADQIEVTGAFEGRSLGLTRFCEGQAEGLALGTDLSESERAQCIETGGVWTTLIGHDNDLPFLLMPPDLAELFVLRSSAYQ